MTEKPLFVPVPDIAEPPVVPPVRRPEPLTVTELSRALKGLVETNFSFVRVRGEISGMKRAGSGHVYFALKDDDSVLDAVCWRGTLSRLSAVPEDGLDVVCTGKLTVYGGRSKYQLTVETLEAAGEGALLKMLEERKRRLEAEGLFAPERKKKIPFLPDVIGVVTSPSGAVIRDILHRLRDRFPCRVLLWPALMQGEGCAEQVAAAVKGFNDLPPEGLQTPSGFIPRPDVLIVARGGGSLEDLMPFNDEKVVRAVAASDIPVISAVGHETDTTLIDYAADLRAPTPTGAAEKAVPVLAELRETVADCVCRLVKASVRLTEDRKNILTGLLRGLPSPERMAEEYTQKLDDRSERLVMALKALLETKRSATERLKPPSPALLASNAAATLYKAAFPLDGLMKNALAEKKACFKTASRLLESFSYERVLERGFALVSDKDGAIVSSASVAAALPELTVRFADGKLSAVPNGTKKSKQSRRKNTDGDRQGFLPL